MSWSRGQTGSHLRTRCASSTRASGLEDRQRGGDAATAHQAQRPSPTQGRNPRSAACRRRATPPCGARAARTPRRTLRGAGPCRRRSLGLSGASPLLEGCCCCCRLGAAWRQPLPPPRTGPERSPNAARRGGREAPSRCAAGGAAPCLRSDAACSRLGRALFSADGRLSLRRDCDQTRQTVSDVRGTGPRLCPAARLRAVPRCSALSITGKAQLRELLAAGEPGISAAPACAPAAHGAALGSVSDRRCDATNGRGGAAA